MASFFVSWAEGMFHSRWGDPERGRTSYERARSLVAEAAKWERLLTLTPSSIVGNEFLLDYGRVLRASGEGEGAKGIFAGIAKEARRLSLAPLADAAQQELNSMVQP